MNWFIRKWKWIVGVLLLLFSISYLAGGYVLYNQLSDISWGCGDDSGNRPEKFTDVWNNWEGLGFDPEPYWMSEAEDVRFSSREAELTLAGWYVEKDPDAPVVIMVHGFGTCKEDFSLLVQAGMLWNNGFNVLLMDVRDAGESDDEDYRSALGTEEYLDVLGAWDWLQAEKGFSAEQIGMMGGSMGASTTLIAFAQEPEVAAVFVDSPFSSISLIIQEELVRAGYPKFLSSSGMLMAWVLSGDNLISLNPIDGVEKGNGRPIFITHGVDDDRVKIHHSEQLEEVANQLEENVTFWAVPDSNHVQAAATATEEYEQRLVAFFTQALK